VFFFIISVRRHHTSGTYNSKAKYLCFCFTKRLNAELLTVKLVGIGSYHCDTIIVEVTSKSAYVSLSVDHTGAYE
jgi:hypothetical protein